MCGICGIIGSSEALAEARTDIVKNMMRRLVHRGPDDEGQYIAKGFNFGHRRLSIIDIKGGHQPILSEDGRYILVFNGEIYNYIELRKNLIEAGVSFRTSSDSEVLLNVLIKEGKNAIPLLNGMFAFVFADTKTGEWIMARDHFGIKPLYYAQTPNEIIFASEIKALLEHPEIPAATCPEGLQQYLVFQYVSDEKTLFKNIYKLEPGFFLQGKGAQITHKTCYWDTDYKIDTHHTDAYFQEKLRELLEDSIRLQMRSDVPLGCYLSGGLDSSLITSLASRQTQKPLSVFTGKFNEGPAYDESLYAKEVASFTGSNYYECIPTAEDFVTYFPKLIYHLDEPVAGVGSFPQMMVSRLAAKNVKVVLGGQGGDEIFGGYARYLLGYLEQTLKGAIFETQEEGQHVVTLNSIIPNLPLLKEYGPLMRQFWSEGLFEDMPKRYFRLIDRSPSLNDFLTSDFLSTLNRDYVFDVFLKTFNHPDTLSYINKMTHYDQKTLLPSLLHVEDRVSMAFSIESRVPLLDSRIVDLITKMPPKIKFKGGETKSILKRAIKGMIPEKVHARKDKMGFPVPFKEWMQKGPVREFVGDTLHSRKSRERGILRPDSIDDLLKSGSSANRQMWGMLCLEMWHQGFIDNKMPAYEKSNKSSRHAA